MICCYSNVVGFLASLRINPGEGGSASEQLHRGVHSAIWKCTSDMTYGWFTHLNGWSNTEYEEPRPVITHWCKTSWEWFKAFWWKRHRKKRLRWELITGIRKSFQTTIFTLNIKQGVYRCCFYTCYQVRQLVDCKNMRRKHVYVFTGVAGQELMKITVQG